MSTISIIKVEHKPILQVWTDELYASREDERWIYQVFVVTLAAEEFTFRCYYSNTGIEVTPCGTMSGLIRFDDIAACNISPEEACMRAAVLMSFKMDRSY